MKKLNFLALFLAIFSVFTFFPHSSLAATPNLSISSLGTNSVQITVNGDANSSVNLYYYHNSLSNPVSVGNIGSTNSSGYFATTLSNNSYNIPSSAIAYVLVNGQQSNNVQWPYNNGNGGQITFSQNNINLNYGQNQTVTIYGGSGSYYISSNSNSNYVNASISGNQLYLSSNNGQYTGGSATITVCSNGGNSSCGYLYVNQNGGGYQQISFSQNNLNLSIGQGTSISIYGNSGSFYISTNSNSNIVSAYISGNTLNVSALQYGSANLTICSYGGSSNCGTVYVTVNNNGGYGGYNNNNGCYYINNLYACPNNGYNNGYYNNPPMVYIQNPTTAYSGYPSAYSTSYGYGTPSAGVYLNQVPATGIKASLKTILFFIGLFMWSAFGAIMILQHRKYRKILRQEM